MSDDLMKKVMDMQQTMQETFNNLSALRVTGHSQDKSVSITLTGTYELAKDEEADAINFDQRALQGGVKEFKWRLREAWTDATKQVQEVTQSKTMELLQGVEVPKEFQDLKSSSVGKDQGILGGMAKELEDGEQDK